MKRALLARAALIAAVLLPHGALSAQDGSRPALEVVATGAPEALAAMAERIRALEARFPIAVRWSAAGAIDVREVVAPRAADATVFARVWLDLSDPERAVIFIANADHDRLLVRVVPASDHYGELTRESLATIVESAIDALLAGGQIGVDRGTAVREIEAQTGTRIAPHPEPSEPVASAEAESTLGPERSPSPERTRPWLIGAYYRNDALSAGPTLRHGLQLALSYSVPLDAPFDLLLAITTQYAPPFSLGDAGRRVTEHGGGARAAVGVTGTKGAFVWRTALGAGADIVRVEPAIDADLGLTAADPFTITTPVATAFVMGSLRPAPWIDLGLGLGLDVPLGAHHFDVQIGSDRSAVISPWSVQPYGFVGIAMPFAVGTER